MNYQEYEVNGQTYKNVVGRLGPQAGPCLVLGAHYDVCGNQPGADDNASGVAALILLARALARAGGRRCTYVFIACSVLAACALVSMLLLEEAHPDEQ